MESIDQLIEAPHVVQRMALAALTAVNHDTARHRKIRDVVIGSRRGQSLGEVVPLVRVDHDDDALQGEITSDVYAVQVSHHLAGFTWTTVVHGQSDHRHFGGEAARWAAILHAVAQVHNGRDDQAAGAFYAGRVLGLPDPE